MLDLLFLLPGLPEHWGRWVAGVYFAIGFRIGLREALATRRVLRGQGVGDWLAPTVILLTLGWPFLIGLKLVDWLVIFAVARDNRRADRETRDV